MCQRLCTLIDNRVVQEMMGNRLQFPSLLKLLFTIFGDGTDSPRSTTEIKEHVFKKRNNRKDTFRADSVLSTLRFLNHFGFADKTGHSEWHIKSVDDMCQRLRELRP